MRHLVLLRGAPGSGKSTFIRDNNLEQYTISADTVRLMFQSPIMTVDGNLAISQSNDKAVWKNVMELLEKRMERGEFTIIDATHSRASLITQYKEFCDLYRYRCTVVDFTLVDTEECLRRNSSRESYKFVPEEAIRKICTRLETDKVPGWIKVSTPSDFISDLHHKVLYDYNNHKKVIVFGDIHGCLDPITEYFRENPYKPENFYIFSGDLFDRGVQNVEVFRFMKELSLNKNVLMLMGNHEKHLFNYGWDKELKNSDFSHSTRKAFEESGINKKEIREFYRRYGQFAYFIFGTSVYLVTHGGMSNVPNTFTATSEMIKGVGYYEDSERVDEAWVKNTPENFYSIHGHRNIYAKPVINTERTFNLCEKVEYGGYLRILEINKQPVYLEVDGFNRLLIERDQFNVLEIKNNTFNPNLGTPKQFQPRNENKPANEIIAGLEKNKYICKKDLGDGIASYNFSSRCFYDKKWNDETVRARGLFVDTETGNVVCRSYDKFFNWGELNSTKTDALSTNLKFPVVAYRKYNGFLGLLSYNPKTDNFFVASKSTDKGFFADYFREIIKDRLTPELLKLLKDNNVSMIFEVIDPVNDPHIIKEEKAKIVLLDVIKNKFDYENVDYETLGTYAMEFDFGLKKVDLIFEDWSSLMGWYAKVKEDTDISHEGWVLTDANSFSVKLKTKYYSFWKYMRSIKDKIAKNIKIDTKILHTELEVKLYNFMNTIPQEELRTMSIIEVREKYENK